MRSLERNVNNEVAEPEMRVHREDLEHRAPPEPQDPRVPSLTSDPS